MNKTEGTAQISLKRLKELERAESQLKEISDKSKSFRITTHYNYNYAPHTVESEEHFEYIGDFANEAEKIKDAYEKKIKNIRKLERMEREGLLVKIASLKKETWWDKLWKNS